MTRDQMEMTSAPKPSESAPGSAYLPLQCTSNACGVVEENLQRSAQAAVGPVPTAPKRNGTDTSTVRSFDIVP